MSQSAPASARKLELYTRISIYGVLALQPLVYLNAFPSSVPARGGLIGFVQAVLSIMVCSRAMTALHDQRRRPTPTEWRVLGPWLTFSAGVLIVMIRQLQPGQVWIPTVAVAVAVPVGVIALLLPALTGLALGLSLGTVAGLLAGWRTQAPMETLLPLGILSGAIVALFALSFWLTGWMLRNIWELEEARRAAAQLAIAQERLRISRDLHDLFGRTMATVAVKTELAGELVRRGRSEAALTQLSEVRSIAEQTGQQVRAVVQGYRPDDLATELHRRPLAAGLGGNPLCGTRFCPSRASAGGRLRSRLGASRGGDQCDPALPGDRVHHLVGEPGPVAPDHHQRRCRAVR